MSALFVRPADLLRDRYLLLSLLHRNLRDLDHKKRFDWLYLDNPAGPARTWFICDEKPENVVASATVFPKFVWMDGVLERCGQVGDFAVDPGYRSLGPALQLQKATFIPVDEGTLAFCYDCPPHDRGMAPFQRLGLSPACRMARFAKLLKSDEHVHRYVPGGGWIHKPISFAANSVLRLRDVNWVPSAGLTIHRQQDPFDAEFDDLDQRCIHGMKSVRSRRFADDLNWKYHADPLHDYAVITARRRDRLEGYAVYQRHERRVLLVEAIASDERIHRALVRAVAGEARQAGCIAVEASAVYPSPEAQLLQTAGFRFRELAQRVVPYAVGNLKELLQLRWSFTGLELLA